MPRDALPGPNPADRDSVVTIINGQTLTRHDIELWESRRAKSVLKSLRSRLGVRAWAELSPHEAVAQAAAPALHTHRQTLTAIKTRLGHAGIYALFRRQIAISERVSRLAVRASRGRTIHSVTRIEAPNCSAVEFAAWFTGLITRNDEEQMVAACPDHYLLRGLADGRQEVVETTGGSPMPTRFLVDYTRFETLSIPVHPDYPIQIAGQAHLDDGVIIGGVRHQFRDEGTSMHALLSVQFPATMSSSMAAAHRWHLATEFSNWIEASRRDARR